MKKLLKSYEFNSDMQYFERIVFLYKRNDKNAAKRMFTDMPLNYRKTFINSALGNWKSSLDNSDIAVFVSIL